MKVFLSGPMGAGKTTVGKRLAELRGARFVDLDEEIERSAGKSVTEIFREEGEGGFRLREATCARHVAAESGPLVVALGGGAVTDPVLRRELLDAGTLITLTASVATLGSRVAGTRTRPLLAGREPLEVLNTLISARSSAYAEAHGTIDTEGHSPDEICAAIEQIVSRDALVVPLGARSYRVAFSSGGLARLGEDLEFCRLRASSFVVVCDRNTERYARTLVLPARVTVVVLEPGEGNKTLAAVESIWRSALAARVDRDAVVVAVGGGVVGDLAGFAASTLLRGVRFVQVPTTVVAMSDSSVGGKTGFDRPEGKNLIGTFHQAAFVLCDVNTLQTLDPRERRAGLAEVVKSAWLDSEQSVAELERAASALARFEPASTLAALRMAVRLKARIVAGDENESGARALLNWGHTLGHAIEASRDYGWISHGEAVALGMVAATEVAVALGIATPDKRGRLVDLLTVLGLSTDWKAHLGDEVVRLLSADKKRAGDRLKYIVVAAPGDGRVVPLEEAELVRIWRSAAG